MLVVWLSLVRTLRLRTFATELGVVFFVVVVVVGGGGGLLLSLSFPLFVACLVVVGAHASTKDLCRLDWCCFVVVSVVVVVAVVVVVVAVLAFVHARMRLD